MCWPSIAWYCVGGVFLYYQQLHSKHFQGSSQGFFVVLSTSVLVGTLTRLAYLGYYGWHISWWAAAVTFFLGVASNLLGVILEKGLGALTLSLAAFVVWPLCAYFMFALIPASSS